MAAKLNIGTTLKCVCTVYVCVYVCLLTVKNKKKRFPSPVALLWPVWNKNGDFAPQITNHSPAVDCEIVNINRYENLDVRYERRKRD